MTYHVDAIINRPNSVWGGTLHVEAAPLHVAAIDFGFTGDSAPGKLFRSMCLLQVLISPYSARQSRACRPPVEPDPRTRPISRGVSTSTRAFTGGLWPAAHVRCQLRHASIICIHAIVWVVSPRDRSRRTGRCGVNTRSSAPSPKQPNSISDSSSHARPGGQGSDLEMCVYHGICD